MNRISMVRTTSEGADFHDRGHAWKLAGLVEAEGAWDAVDEWLALNSRFRRAMATNDEVLVEVLRERILRQ